MCGAVYVKFAVASNADDGILVSVFAPLRGETHTSTVTRRNVAGIVVRLASPLVFFSLNRASSSAKSSRHT